MTLEQFINGYREYWEKSQTNPDLMYTAITNDRLPLNLRPFFFSFKWTSEIEQWATDLWITENSKLGKALK